jgi:hypothetical protein
MNNSEWQIETDSFGRQRRFRFVGQSPFRVKEYEAEITTTKGTFPESKLKQINREDKPKPQPQPQAPLRRCPFSKGINQECKGKLCAFFNDGCALANVSQEATRETAGLLCPLNNYPCGKTCALYNGGCTIHH